MKILLSTQCFLPIPATKGGAVPTLLESLINQNEIEENLSFSIITLYDPSSKEVYSNYKNTNFIFIKRNLIIEKIDEVFDFFQKKFLRKEEGFSKRYLWKLYVLIKTKGILKNGDFDKVVFENSGFLLNVLKDKNISNKYRDNLYYHLHNNIPLNINMDCVNKCKTIVISNYLKQNVISLMGEDYKSNIIILKNGIKLDAFFNELKENEKNAIKKKLNIENKKIITFIGRISKEKGIEELINAVELIEDKNCVLLIIGSHNFGTDDKSLFEKRITYKINKMKDKIVFTGYVKHDEVWKYYKLSDLVVLPSTWEEPAGLTMLEAVASDRPLITTLSGGIPEYISGCDVIMLKIDENLTLNIKDSIIKSLNKNHKINNRTKIIKYNEQNFYKNFVAIMNKKR